MTAPELIRQVKDLPPVSPAAMKLVGLLNRPTQHNDEVIQVLRYDSALTARLLRACNASSLALLEPVTSVDQAVLLLGHQVLVRFVLALGFSSALRRPLPGYAAEQGGLWRHSLATALAAEQVSIRLGRFEPAVAFTAGLLHDIGKLVLSQVLAHEDLTVVRKRIEQSSGACVEAEMAIFGTDHAKIGECLLSDWRLPTTIVEAVANHHRPAVTQDLHLSAVVHVGNDIAHLLGSAPGGEDSALRAEDPVLNALGLTPEVVEEITLSVHDSLQRTDESLGTT